jgi:hypothetical protein
VRKRSYFEAILTLMIKKKIQIYVNVSSLNFSVSVRSLRVALFDITSRISRISIKRRFRILIVSKTDEFSRDRHAVMNDDDDEKSNMKNDNRSNCIRCCRLSVDCRFTRRSDIIKDIYEKTSDCKILLDCMRSRAV